MKHIHVYIVILHIRISRTRKNYLHMRSVICLCLLLTITFVFTNCSKDDDQNLDLELQMVLEQADPVNGMAGFRQPLSNDYASIPQDPRNPITTEKVTLGRLLYHETALGVAPERMEGLGTYSCASCHFASAGFQAGRFQGIGEGGTGIGTNGQDRLRLDTYNPEELDVQPIRSPTVLNVAYQPLMLWNGQFGAGSLNEGTESEWAYDTPIETNFLGYEGVETQAIAGLKVHRMDLDDALLDEHGYRTLFDAAFPGVAEDDRYNRETAGLAIAAYERTLLANRSPFQRFLQGKSSAMTASEKVGAILFFGKAGCVSCHNGPALNSMTFYGVGMADLDQCGEEVFKTTAEESAHLGRGGFTKRSEDNYKFKTPTLYNLADSPFYGHGASFTNVRDVVNYFNEADPQNARVPGNALAADFVPLGLTEEEISDITTFLTSGLRDPELSRYEPAFLLSGNCFPNNDDRSRQDMGCE